MTLPPLEFALTAEEARIAAARASWRGALSGGLLGPHLAPLAGFALWTLFAAVLGLTGLIARRPAEIALIAGAAAYMIYRLWTRRRFARARRSAMAWTERVRDAGAVRITLDEAGLSLDGAGPPLRWRFAEGLEIEDAGGIVYVWPRSGPPAFWPSRAHADAEDAARYLAFARARLTGCAPPPR